MSILCKCYRYFATVVSIKNGKVKHIPIFAKTGFH